MVILPKRKLTLERLIEANISQQAKVKGLTDWFSSLVIFEKKMKHLLLDSKELKKYVFKRL